MSRVGYWQSTWPVECGDNHRPKVVTSRGLNLQPTDRLVATTRHTGRWPVMFVQRDEGELYLQGTTVGSEPEVSGWVERVDPVTLAPLASSGDLPAGGHEWCGSIAVHQNGDLYTVNGSFLHRLAPDCSIVAEAKLPVDHAHNGLLILGDGSIVTKDLRLGDVPSTVTICNPDLGVIASIELPEASMGRISAVTGVSAEGHLVDHIYVPGVTKVFRCGWDGRALTRDEGWTPSYREAGRGGLAWDTTISDGRVWLMDNGNVPAVEHRFSQIPTLRSSSRVPAGEQKPTWDEPVRAIGIAVNDPSDITTLIPTEHPSGWIIAPPLVHEGIAVVWDTGNTGIAAFDVGSAGAPEMLWFQPFRTSMQPMLYPETGELIINDYRFLDENETSDDLVVLDIRTGQMKARVPTGATRMNGMFLCPGWDRDLYYCTFGTVARIRVESL